MGLFYAVLLQATPATKNYQADYPPATYSPYVYIWGWVGVAIIKLKANLSFNWTGLGLDWN